MNKFWLRLVIRALMFFGGLIVIVSVFAIALVIYSSTLPAFYANNTTPADAFNAFALKLGESASGSVLVLVGAIIMFLGVVPYLAFAQLLQLFVSMEESVTRIQTNTFLTGALMKRLVKQDDPEPPVPI